MPPQRIALVAIVLLMLAGAGAWWWQARTAVPHARAVQEASTTVVANRISGTAPRAPVASDPEKPDPSVMAAGEQCGNALMAVMRERTRQLERRDDATSQLALALMPYMEREGSHASSQDSMDVLLEHRAMQQRAFKRARQLDPDHPDIAWLAAEKCVEGPECAAAHQAALQAEPDNAAVWVRAMTWARMRSDDAALEDAFKRAAAAPHYDTHRGSTLLAVKEGYAGLPTPAICMDSRLQAFARRELPPGRSLDAMTLVEMMAMAGEAQNAIYGMELRTLCKAEDGGVLPSDRQADCVRIYSTMASDPDTVEQWMALSQLVELTAGAPEGPALRERFRQLQWLFEQQQKNAKELDHLAIGASDVETMQAALAKAGRWPPPADWLPEDERSRSLILTGRPPAETKRK